MTTTDPTRPAGATFTPSPALLRRNSDRSFVALDRAALGAALARLRNAGYADSAPCGVELARLRSSTGCIVAAWESGAIVVQGRNPEAGIALLAALAEPPPVEPPRRRDCTECYGGDVCTFHGAAGCPHWPAEGGR